MAKHSQSAADSRSSRGKILATVVAVGATASVAGLGTFGAWTSSTTADTATYTAGDVSLVKVDDVTKPITVGMSNMAPGDSAQRALTLTNDGSLDYASLTMNVTATTSSTLDTDPTNGLKVNVDKCVVATVPTAWVWDAVNNVFTCGAGTGTVTSVLTSAAVVGTHTLTPVAAATATGVDQLRVTVTLPTTAPQATMEGDSSVLSINFTGTARAGAPQAS